MCIYTFYSHLNNNIASDINAIVSIEKIYYYSMLVNTLKYPLCSIATLIEKKSVNKKRLGSLNNCTFIASCYKNGKNILMW